MVNIILISPCKKLEKLDLESRAQIFFKKNIHTASYFYINRLFFGTLKADKRRVVEPLEIRGCVRFCMKLSDTMIKYGHYFNMRFSF